MQRNSANAHRKKTQRGRKKRKKKRKCPIGAARQENSGSWFLTGCRNPFAIGAAFPHKHPGLIRCGIKK
jgi:hypothetical protein